MPYMPRHARLIAALLLLASSGSAAFAANAAPTYRNVQDQLAQLSPSAPEELKTAAKKLDDYLAKLVKTTDLDARLAAYRALAQDTAQWQAWSVSDPAAANVAYALNRWVTPRLQAMEYGIAARDAVKRGDNWVTDEHRKIYSELVEPLAVALEQYEAADKTSLRVDARERIRSLTQELERRGRSVAWPDADQIIATIKSRWEAPNFLLTVSAEGLRPLLDRGIVNNEAIIFKGRTSYVTPRERYGYGLIPTPDAISFYIQQAMTSVTPVTDFEQQVANNQGGRILTRAYNLSNTIQNDSILTMSVAVRPSGVAMTPSYQNNVRPNLGIGPRSGGGLTRAFMGMAGMNQQRIVDEIYSRSIGQIQSETEINSKELGQQRADEGAAKINQTLAQYRRGPNTFGYEKIVAEQLNVRTEPTHIHAEARLLYDRPGTQSIGPLDIAPPLDPVDSRYITTAIHIPNLMENLATNFFLELAEKGTSTIAFMPDNDGDGALEIDIQTGQDLLQNAVGESIRITKAPKDAKLAPGSPFAAITISQGKLVPHFTMDDKGHLVMMLKSFKMDIAAPALALLSEGRMGGAVRIDSPGAELDMEIINLPATDTQQERLALKVHSFQLDPRSKIYAYTEAGKEPAELSAFKKAAVLAGASAFLSSKPIDLPLDALKIGDKISVVKVAPLGKLGWFQFVINADNVMDDLGTPPGQQAAPATVPAQVIQQPKSDVAILPMGYTIAPVATYTVTVPAGASYCVVPGTNPPRVEYDPSSIPAGPIQWVNINVTPQP